MLHGTGASPGIGLAKAVVWHPSPGYDYIPRKSASPAREVDRFETARRALHNKSGELRDKAARMIGDDEAGIFEAYRMALDDEDGLLEPLRRKIWVERYTAEYAVTVQFNELAREFSQMDDEYLRQRVDDVFSLRDLLMRELLGQQATISQHLIQPSVVVAQTLSPTDVANLDLSRLIGIVCEEGGYSSHTSIIARTLGIPAVVAATGIVAKVHSGTLIGIDGETGEIWVDPDENEIHTLYHRKTLFQQHQASAKQYLGCPTITRDGHRIELSAAIGKLDEVDYALQADAEALGIFRTEMLHLEHNGLPSEEEQYFTYRKLAEKMGGKPVTVRLYDDGGNLPFTTLKPHAEQNPVLGYRGIRVCLGRPSFFRTQLRAVLRASNHGPLRILLPMVATNDELDAALAAIEQIKQELRREESPFDENIKVGLLVEVPSVAIMCRHLAAKVDFFSIGITDLIQFTLAVDRSNPDLAGLLHLYHPAVLRLIRKTVNAAHSENIPCYLSGEVPGLHKVLPLLMGMGIDGFALSPGSILDTRKELVNCSYREYAQLAETVLELETVAKIKQCLGEAT